LRVLHREQATATRGRLMGRAALSGGGVVLMLAAVVSFGEGLAIAIEPMMSVGDTLILLAPILVSYVPHLWSDQESKGKADDPVFPAF
jgi:hypothetical protein